MSSGRGAVISMTAPVTGWTSAGDSCGGQGGDESAILRAIEPVAGEGVTDGGHVYPQLVCASGGGGQPQQGAALGRLQHLIMGVCGLPCRVGLPPEQ